ncbi:hypothetical protein FRC00_001364 [Tulasnella sp. 408]|nr:hypothetical protein FRC00_001364 [Tulasnella sp. 408]
MAQRVPRPSSAPPAHTQAPGPPSDLGVRVDEVRKAVIFILKDTDWPEEASNDVQDLIREMEAPLALDKLPKEATEVPEELNTAVHQLLGHMESAQTRLKGESEKYGIRKKGLRKSVKILFSRKDPTQCKEVVRGCRADIEGSSTTLNVNAHNDVTATSVPSNSPPAQSSLQSNQVSSSKGGKQKGSSTRGEWLDSANKAFKIAEGASGALPVVGSYVGAVAKVGLTVVEMVQTMEGNDETAERLGNHVWRLSNVLERVSKHSQGSEKTQTIEGMNELQQELHSVQQQIKELQAQRGMKKVWSSSDNAGSLKNLQEQVRAALEEIQLLANLNISILVNELRKHYLE